MTARGQGRGLLVDGRVRATALPPDRIPVAESRVDLPAAARDVVAATRGLVQVADADDEVQAVVASAWLSGRGLPSDRTEARAEIRRFVVRRLVADASGARRGRAASDRRRAANQDAWPVVAGVTIDAVALAPTTWVGPTQIEAAVDARSAAEQAGRDLAPALLAASGGWFDADSAGATGVTRARAQQVRAEMLARLREWALTTRASSVTLRR